MSTIFSRLNISSKEELDQAAKEISEALNAFFPPAPKFEGKKKKKLRDVVAYLDGYRNGHSQELLDKIDRQVAFNNIPETDMIFELPDTLIIKTSPYDIENEMLIGTNGKADFESFYNDHEIDRYDVDTCLHVLFGDEGEPVDFPDYNELRDLPIWQYICQRYLANHAIVEMPSIQEYGIDHEATDDGALDMLAHFHLKPDESFQVTPCDRGDDGSTTAYILLRKKPNVARYSVCCNNKGEATDISNFIGNSETVITPVEELIASGGVELRFVNADETFIDKVAFFEHFENSFTRVPLDYFDRGPLADLAEDLATFSADALQIKYQSRAMIDYPYLYLNNKEWQRECAEGNTKLGYWEWVSHSIESLLYDALDQNTTR